MLKKNKFSFKFIMIISLIIKCHSQKDLSKGLEIKRIEPSQVTNETKIKIEWISYEDGYYVVKIRGDQKTEKIVAKGKVIAYQPKTTIISAAYFSSCKNQLIIAVATGSGRYTEIEKLIQFCPQGDCASCKSVCGCKNPGNKGKEMMVFVSGHQIYMMRLDIRVMCPIKPILEKLPQAITVSFDGKWIIIKTEDGIYSLDVENQDIQKIGEGLQPGFPSFKKDSYKIIFATSQGIYEKKLGSSNSEENLLLQHSQALLPRWISEDMFCFYAPGQADQDIFISNGTIAQGIQIQGDDILPTPSPNGDKIVFFSRGRDGLAMMDVPQTFPFETLPPITKIGPGFPSSSSDQAFPSFSLDKERFAYSYNGIIYLGQLSPLKEATPLSGADKSSDKNYQPQLSPSGKNVIFTSQRTGNEEIYIKDIEKGTIKNLTQNPAPDKFPRLFRCP